MEQQTLRTFTLPFDKGQVLLPHSSMVEVLPFATPLRLDNAPPWVVGTLLWRSLNVPLVALATLVFNAQPNLDSHTRIVMINTLDSRSRLPYMGLLGTDAPRLVNLHDDDLIRVDPPAPDSSAVLMWVQVKEQIAIIPDLDAIEASLAPLMQLS